ncbi:MAG: translation initiation factor [Methylacidiphilales bacterium]|nr:translation initiation factor [Candidatus Methylacidiphilales bacterium]
MKSNKKVDVSGANSPLQQNPFAMLGELDALKNLPAPAPVPVDAPKPKPAAPAKSRGRLILRRETKDRGGKVVMVISGLAELPGANAVMIGNLAKELKGKLGCGGSFDRQEIVLQGDRCAQVCGLLEEMGYRVDGVRA